MHVDEWETGSKLVAEGCQKMMEKSRGRSLDVMNETPDLSGFPLTLILPEQSALP